MEQNRIAIIGIIIESNDSIESVNRILHEFNSYIIGRMGIPYRDRGVNIISVALDAPQNVINNVAGKLGRVDGVSSKALSVSK